jgi:hypothetical protein
MRVRVPLIWCTAACFACASTATIQRFDGPDTEAEIERSDADALYVRGSNGQLYRLDRSKVGAIDHPGNVNLAIGAALVALAIVAVAVPNDKTSRQDKNTAAAIYALPGLPLLVGGLFIYMRSRGAASAFENATAGYILRPPPPPLPKLPPPRPVLSPDAGADLDGGGADATGRG